MVVVSLQLADMVRAQGGAAELCTAAEPAALLLLHCLLQHVQGGGCNPRRIPPKHVPLRSSALQY
jgi:hypothetical protein